MVTIVQRVAQMKGLRRFSLLPAWEREVQRALKRNDGEYDSRSFIFAAHAFLENEEVTISIQDIKAGLNAKGPRQDANVATPAWY